MNEEEDPRVVAAVVVDWQHMHLVGIGSGGASGVEEVIEVVFAAATAGVAVVLIGMLDASVLLVVLFGVAAVAVGVLKSAAVSADSTSFAEVTVAKAMRATISHSCYWC